MLRGCPNGLEGGGVDEHGERDMCTRICSLLLGMRPLGCECVLGELDRMSAGIAGLSLLLLPSARSTCLGSRVRTRLLAYQALCA